MRRIVAALAIAASPLLASEQVERDLPLPLPLFSAASPWNQRADTAAVAPDSEAQVLVLWRVLLGDATTVTPREAVPASPFPFPRVSSAEYSVPIARAGRGRIEIPLGDHARDLRGALLAGLILPEDIEHGAIEHALAFAVPGLRNTNAADPYEPFAADAGFPSMNTDAHAIAAGQRIRLRASLVDEEGAPLDETQLAPVTRMFLAALRTYGAYAVDNARAFAFYAEDSQTARFEVTDERLRELIGASAAAPLPAGRTGWQILIDALNAELELIPLAAGSWRDYGSGGNDARTATYSRANFEIVEPAGVVPRRRRLVRRDSAPAWRPAAGTSWQIQLDGTLDTTVEAALWEIDAADHDAATVAALHAAGAKVICYVNAGAWEEWRSDAAQFPPSVIGKEYAGWPGERWLDIRRLDVLGPILEARLDVCAGKGFDAADPDNLDGYQQDTGFPLTATDQLAFNRFLAREAHERGLAIALKNDFDQASALEPDFDFAVTESCFHYDECTALQPFLDRGKAVLAIEYTDTGATLESFCADAKRLGISAILKNRPLDAWRGTCP